jgi:CTP-dependent riboflavin kinase
MPYLNDWKTPCKLLLALYKNNNNSNVKRSILDLGRDFYSCNNSIYDAIDWYSDKGLIVVKKLKRDLHIKFTDKGNELTKAIWLIDGLN